MLDYVRPDALYLYLGDDGPDFTTRIGFYRVTPDGTVWINSDPTGLDDRWTPIQ